MEKAAKYEALSQADNCNKILSNVLGAISSIVECFSQDKQIHLQLAHNSIFLLVYPQSLKGSSRHSISCF